MSSQFRRKARRIGGDDDDTPMGNEEGMLWFPFNYLERLLTITDSEPVVRRPKAKPKRESKLRLSFGPGETSMMEDGADEDKVFKPKKLGARKNIIEKSSLKQSWTPSSLPENVAVRAGQDEDRPVYDKGFLDELRNSTPSTPKDMYAAQSGDERRKSLDIAGKFGEVVRVSSTQMAIPTEAEIREKKERRARLAKEQEYISLNDDDEAENSDEDWRAGKETETRLVRDDVDFAEGFEEFVEDGRITLTGRAELEQKRRHREEMQGMIEEAENISDSDDSEMERRTAFDTAQIRAGTKKDNFQEPSRPKTPPKIVSLPTLASKLTQLRSSIATMQNSRTGLLNRLDEIRKEKADIAVREVEIQDLLKDAGDKYEKLRLDAGLSADSEKLLTAPEVETKHGLENLGSVSMPGSEQVSDEG